MLKDARDREHYESYTAQVLWMTARAVYGMTGNDFDFPQYVELIHPETKEKEMTADEIINHVIELFGGTKICS